MEQTVPAGSARLVRTQQEKRRNEDAIYDARETQTRNVWPAAQRADGGNR
jgi:hypothetical protein